jgi:hypothetical protein
MGKDDFYKKRKQEREARKRKERKIKAETWLFVCEGVETEPNYIKDLIKYANSKSDKTIKIKVEGVGKNTESLVKSVDKYFADVDVIKTKEDIPYGKIFTVFDKDSFEKSQFNNAISISHKKGYIPIWSNECIELWFLLHFSFFTSDVHRTEYFDKLSKIFNKNYKKSDYIFNMLNSDKNLKTAVNNAKRLYCETQNISSYSNRVPCTTVFKLIKEIEEYLGIKL